MFLDHSSYKRGNDLYGGDRLQLLFRCALLSKVRQGGQEWGRGGGRGENSVSWLMMRREGEEAHVALRWARRCTMSRGTVKKRG